MKDVSWNILINTFFNLISREIYQVTKIDTTRWINLIILSKLYISFCGHGSLHIWPSHLLLLFLQFYIIMDILFWVAISLRVMLKIIVQSKMAFSVWPEIVTSQKIWGEYIFPKIHHVIRNNRYRTFIKIGFR